MHRNIAHKNKAEKSDAYGYWSMNIKIEMIVTITSYVYRNNQTKQT